jgi:hypothetical protein
VLKTAGASAVLGRAGLAGCSSDGDGDGGGDGGDGGGYGGDGGSTTTTTAEPIVIGATMPQTGPLSSTADAMITGYDIGVDRINDEGGIDGREVELILRDDKSEAREVRNQLQQIVSENDVAMLWGSFSSLLVTSTRHRDALQKARKHVRSAIDGLNRGMTGDFLSIDLRAALKELGTITGEITTEALLDSIFSRFCIGK